ncbi:YwqJ-related putative deaminase [Tenacibaculum tangerinum]|uniref:YwqJ-related putative deaminase n=1 Tax=Tenacibaculum tangerinum TaxID=3038772 RepID=A0ABY8L1X8_9FLAO|nr:YwqJ-related putative deaminase [Tenacibaculum tangerinum]WGH74657.1 YwqJ-related putative deaminase [Tenacibaculum tangerinum]
MHAHEYGSKHFKHKTNFEGLVVFSDVQQQKIKETENPSPNIYVEIEKGVQNPNKWFLHINSTLSGEYGDFFLQENPQPVGEIVNDFDYDISPENTAFIESYYDFNLGVISYYKIHEKFYIKLWGDILKEETFFEIQNSSKSKTKEEISIEYDAFITLFVSDNGAKLERAYQRITKVNPHQIVVFIESGGGTNALGTVFRIHKGKNVQTLPEVDRFTLAKVARAFGVEVQANDFSEMVREELATKDSLFYLLVTKKFLKGGKIIRWSANEVFTDISGDLKNTSRQINELKLKEQRWNTAFKDKSGAAYDPLLPKLRGKDRLFDAEKFSNEVYKTHLQPVATQASSIAKLLLTKRQFAKLIPFDISKFIEVLDAIPKLLQDFFKEVSNYLVDLYEYINGLIVGLINSIIEFIKSFVDILAMLFDVLNAAIQSSTFFENPASYLSLFAESFENLIDGFVALFSLENLKAVVGFLASVPIETAKLLVRFLASDTKVRIDPGALGYYIGLIAGFIASEIAMFFLTGGTGTIAKAVKETLRSYKALAEIPAKVADNVGKLIEKTFKFGIDTFVKLAEVIADFIKNIPKHLSDLKKWIGEFFEGLSKAVRTFSDEVYTIFEKLGVTIKKVPQPPVLASGIPVPIGDNVYALVKDGKELFRGTKKEVEEFSKLLDKIDEKKQNKLIKRVLQKAKKSIKISKQGLLKLDIFVDEALQIHIDRRPGAAAILEGTINGKLKTIVSYSSKGLSRKEIRNSRHKLVDEWLEVIAKSKYPKIYKRKNHGRCAEPNNISEWLFQVEKSLGIKNNSISIEQARVAFADVVSKAKRIYNSEKSKLAHGLHKSACDSCNPLLEYFNIKEIF